MLLNNPLQTRLNLSSLRYFLILLSSPTLLERFFMRPGSCILSSSFFKPYKWSLHIAVLFIITPISFSHFDSLTIFPHTCMDKTFPFLSNLCLRLAAVLISRSFVFFYYRLTHCLGSTGWQDLHHVVCSIAMYLGLYGMWSEYCHQHKVQSQIHGCCIVLCLWDLGLSHIEACHSQIQ